MGRAPKHNWRKLFLEFNQSRHKSVAEFARKKGLNQNQTRTAFKKLQEEPFEITQNNTKKEHRITQNPHPWEMIKKQFAGWPEEKLRAYLAQIEARLAELNAVPYDELADAEKKELGRLRRERRAILSDPDSERICSAVRNGKRCQNPAERGKGVCWNHGGAPGSGPPPGSKNALKTGEREAIWMDALGEDEQALVHRVSTNPLEQADEAIRLLTIRERRMMQRIQNLKNGLTEKQRRVLQQRKTFKEPVTVHDDDTGQQKVVIRSRDELVVAEIEETEYRVIEDILRIEEALTRVQDRKLKAIGLKHKIEAELGGRPDPEACPDPAGVPGEPGGPREYIERHFWIKSKDKRVVLLRFNAIQDRYWRAKTGRDIILKFRQPGFSTLKIAQYFERVVNEDNVTAVIVAHDLESTQKLFKIVQLMYDRLPEEKKRQLNRGLNKPKYGNRREYFFIGNNSNIYVGTAGSVDFGRSQTINYLLCSEVAFWSNPEEVMTGLLQAVPYDGEICIETTANGVGNYFYREYQDAKQGRSRFKAHFFAWFEHDEYRLPLGPGEVLEYTAEERELAERYGLEPGQVKWRRWKISEIPDKDGLSKEDRFRQEYPEDDTTCFLYSGRPALNLHAVQAIRRRAELVEPLRFTIDHVNGEIVRDPFGELLVWDEPMPGRRYVLGADVAEGKRDGDYSCGEVLDWETSAQCAELHGHWDPDIYGKKLAVLGCWYNGALLGVERNNHGHSVLNTLINQVRYPNLYYHVDLESVKYKESDDPGWPTTPVTRPVMMADLKEAVREGLDVLSIPLLDECQSFIVNAKGKEEAQPGSKDDRVMALAIALQLRKQESPGIYF